MQNISCPRCGRTGTIQRYTTELVEGVECTASGCDYKTSDPTEFGKLLDTARGFAIGTTVAIGVFKLLDSWFGKRQA